MPRRRLALLAAFVVVPLGAYAATAWVLKNDGSKERLSANASSRTTRAPSTTTSTSTSTAVTPTSVASSPTSSSAQSSSGTGSTLPTRRPGQPVAPSDPKALAAEMAATDAALRDSSTSPDEFKRYAHLQQVEFRALVNKPSLQAPTYSQLAPALRAVVEANVVAGAKLRSMITSPKSTLPAWRIVTPAPADELLGYYREAESELGVGWQYLAAIHLVETRMGRIRGTSTAGAQGPMQFLPATWKQYGNGGDINSNRDSIAAAARLLKRNGAPGDMRNAIYNYNHDQRYVDAVLTYAERMTADERAYAAYHGWQVYYVTTEGDVWLPEGYEG